MKPTSQNTAAAQPKAAHTPGPWETGNAVARDSLDDSRWVSAIHKQAMTQSGHVITSWAYGDTPDEVRANARLIAAAPELLAALEHIAALVDLNKPEMQRAFDKAIAAIAKATS